MEAWIRRRALDDGEEWLAAIDGEPAIRFRVRMTDATGESRQATDASWRQRFRIAIERSTEGEPLKWLIVEKWRYDIATPDDGAAGALQSLDEHQRLTAEKADHISERLELPGACPVEYKVGAPQVGEDGVGIWDTDKMQLGLQCLILVLRAFSRNVKS